MSLVYYDGWIGAQRRKKMLGPGAASAAEFEAPARPVGLTSAAWLALMIATGIGLHNFSEGLAIGQSAAADEVTLALTLVIGFALHNATEGFGIVAPLSGVRRAADLALLAPARSHRRQPDVPRHADRPGVDERGASSRSSPWPQGPSSTSSSSWPT